MKKFLLLMLIAVSAFASPVLAQDTVVNNGDDKVVIIDKRPKIVSPVKTVSDKEQQILKLTRDLDNLYSYNETLENEIKKLKEETDRMKLVSDLDKYYSRKYDTAELPYVLLALGIVAAGLYLLYKSNSKSCDCNHKQPQAPVINHFNVAGGSAVIDGSENFSNMQSENHYHTHCLPPMIQERSSATKTSEAAT